MGSLIEQVAAVDKPEKRALPPNHFTSTEYAAHLGIADRNGWQRLKRLEQRGVVAQRILPGNIRCWEFLGRGEQSGGTQKAISQAQANTAGAVAVAGSAQVRNPRGRRARGGGKRGRTDDRRKRGGA